MLAAPSTISAPLDAIAEECYRNSAAHGFHDELTPLPQGLMLIVSEAAEALEAFRDDVWIDYEMKANGLVKPLGVMSELADIVIRVLDTAVEVQAYVEGTIGKECPSIGQIVVEKMIFNESRPVGHGRVRL